MKKVKIIEGKNIEFPAAILEDFTFFEEKMTRKKHIKEIRQNLDKMFVISAIDELDVKNKKISAKKFKKVFKKVLSKMMEELEG